MSQGKLSLAITGTYGGLAAAEDINEATDALVTKSAGNSAPANAGPEATPGPVLGQDWLDTAGAQEIWKIYSGSAWLKFAVVDATAGIAWVPLGGGDARASGGSSGALASAGTTDLGSKHETNIDITGTTTITSFGSSARQGEIKVVCFRGVLQLTHHATSMILPTGANITTAAGDQAIMLHLGSGNWRAVDFIRANGKALAADSITALNGLTHLGIAATADATNYPFRVLANRTLHEAKTAAGGGTGDAVHEMSKEAAGDDSGLELKIGSTKYAKLGLLGSADISLLVSPDDFATPYTAWSVDRTDGGLTIPRVANYGHRWTDKGTVGSGTVTFNRLTGGPAQRLQMSGNLTIAFSNWPASGIFGDIVIELRAEGYTVTWPTMRWLLANGQYQSTQPRAFAGAGWTDWVIVWTRDNGSTLWARFA